MSNDANAGATDERDSLRFEPATPDAVATTETYETDEGTVFYDAQNPLAWLQTDDPRSLSEMV
ncbi:MAG: hypothetical protein ABEJ89_00655 [Haloarculaceae archaeon]